MSRSARPVHRLGAATLVIAFGLAACGGSGPSAAPATPAPSGTVLLEAREYAFAPSTLAVAAGTVTFSVRNAGNDRHEFEVVQGKTVVDKLEGLTPGLAKDLTVTLVAGEYTFVCRLNGHDQLGMRGTLTVTGG